MAFSPLWLCFFPQDAGAGLLAAAMIAVVPGYISRSVAGSYDNEGEFVTLRAGKPVRNVGCWNTMAKTLQGTTEEPSSPSEPRWVPAVELTQPLGDPWPFSPMQFRRRERFPTPAASAPPSPSILVCKQKGFCRLHNLCLRSELLCDSPGVFSLFWQ